MGNELYVLSSSRRIMSLNFINGFFYSTVSHYGFLYKQTVLHPELEIGINKIKSMKRLAMEEGAACKIDGGEF
ncbi:hypothetical protein VNO80_05831 [Phaseolus coccineus]|uniref:Uncharacterized protein n=1 Tax=Phaseolus coccineus TaxID=3886 RepID=A0AAN9RIF7_PHACN